LIQITDFEELRRVLYAQNADTSVEELVTAIAHLVLLSQMDTSIVMQAQQVVGGN